MLVKLGVLGVLVKLGVLGVLVKLGVLGALGALPLSHVVSFDSAAGGGLRLSPFVAPLAGRPAPLAFNLGGGASIGHVCVLTKCSSAAPRSFSEYLAYSCPCASEPPALWILTRSA